jgi:hypothetical protein
MKSWVIVLVLYAAPPNAVDWPGPWQKGKIIAGENFYPTEGICRNEAVQWIARVHAAGMLAPFRFQCVPFPASLPVGAPRG